MISKVSGYSQMADDMNVVLKDWAMSLSIDSDRGHRRTEATARLKKAGLRFDADRTTFKVIS